MLFDAVRPVILNGIDEIIDRPDLADRCILLTLEAIPEKSRRSEEELWAAFETARPRILGALLDGVVKGLAMLPQTKLEKLPRMADFARWATACETAAWPAGTFEAAYCGNRKAAVDGVLESDLVAVALRAFVAKRTEWTGTATDLLALLILELGEPQNKVEGRLAANRRLGRYPGRLRRAATFLRKVGVEITFKHAGTRRIHISSGAENYGIQPSASSIPSIRRAEIQSWQWLRVTSRADDGEQSGR